MSNLVRRQVGAPPSAVRRIERQRTEEVALELAREDVLRARVGVVVRTTNLAISGAGALNVVAEQVARLVPEERHGVDVIKAMGIAALANIVQEAGQ